MMQKTIQKQASIEGAGLHSGKTTHLVFKPSADDRGIVFKRVDLNPAVEISTKDFEYAAHDRRTAIRKSGAEVHTIEHLMAALWALSIDNIIIETDGEEMPGMDGSAAAFYECLKNAGIKELDRPAKEIVIKEPVWFEKKDAIICIVPSQKPTVSYLFESPSPVLGRQYLSIDMDESVASKEVISARTFCLRQEAEMLQKMGFGKGANTQNTLVMDVNGPIDNKLRFPDEPVRHKIMDLLGDLYLAGGRIRGRVIAIKSGHDMNMEIVKRIRSANP